MAVGFGAFNLIATELIGPKVAGKVKMSSYELTPSAPPVRSSSFYVLVTFLLFDVGSSCTRGLFFYLGRVLFVLTSIVAYVYAWRKGVFRFD